MGFIIFVVFALLASIILFLTGTIMYAVRTVKENTGNHTATSKKASLIILTIGIVCDLIIFLVSLCLILALVFRL